jgi:glycosyltransferase involved in cell wall biosynthesis
MEGDRAVKFACLHHGDPLSEGLWSGIPLNIVRTLRELGHEVIPVGGLKPEVPLFGRIKTAFYKYARRKQYLMNRDPRVIALRARDGNRRLKDLGPVDAVLITYPPNAAYLVTPDPVVILHDATWAQLLDYYPGYERKTLAAETIRGGMELDRLALHRCDHAIYASQWAATGAIERFGVSPAKVSVAPLGANIADAPSRSDVASYLKLRGQGPMQLLFLGVEWHRKGGDIAVAVAAEIARMGIDVELHVAGCDPEGEVPAFVRPHGILRKNVKREAEKLRGLLESSDFLILPTRADAFGIVFAEAAAYGLPVMTTDTGGVKDAVRGEWGIALPPGAPVAHYARWAAEKFRKRAEYERLSWLARGSYEKDLNWPAFCRHVLMVVAACRRHG